MVFNFVQVRVPPFHILCASFLCLSTFLCPSFACQPLSSLLVLTNALGNDFLGLAVEQNLVPLLCGMFFHKQMPSPKRFSHLQLACPALSRHWTASWGEQPSC